MKIQPSPPASLPRALNEEPNKPPDPPEDESWWNEVGLGSLLLNTLHLTPERINSTVESARDLGKSVAVSWPNLRDQVEKVLGHPLVGHLPVESDTVAGAVMYGAGALGYGVAGIEGLAGVARLISGVRHNNKQRVLEGLLDVTAGAAIASTIMGAGQWPLILGPIAGGLGIARGAVHVVRAYQKADGKARVQGFLDATRSAAVMSSLLGSYHPAGSWVACVLGPVAATVQACRGYVNLSQGLKEKDKGSQVSGLKDIGTAVGMIMSFSGMAIPGIAVTVASQVFNLAYKVLPPVEKLTNKALGFANLPLRLVVGATDKIVDPVLGKVRDWIDNNTNWQHGEDKPPDPKE